MSNLPPYPGGFPEYPEDRPRPPLFPGGPPYGGAVRTRPTAVRRAVSLMYTGALLSLVGALVAPLTRHNIRRLVENARPNDTVTQINHSVDLIITIAIVAGAIDAALWVWMAIANGRGNSWARVTGTVFFGISTLGVLVNIAQHNASVSKVLAVIVWLVGLATVVLLWRPESSRYFSPPPPGYPPPPDYQYPPGPQNPWYQ